MTRPNIGQSENFRLSQDPLNPHVDAQEFDLSIERDAAKGTAEVWPVRGISVFSAPVNADIGLTEAGAVKISGDVKGSAGGNPNSFFFMPGTALGDWPFSKLTIENPPQPGRKAYLYASGDFNFPSAIFTPAVEAMTGRQEIVRFGDPNDSNEHAIFAWGTGTGSSYAILGFQEDRVKKEMLKFMSSRGAVAGYTGFRKVRDAVGRDAEFTKQGQTYLYRMTGATAQYNLLDALPPAMNAIGYAKFRFTLLHNYTNAESFHALSAEVYNRFGVYECTPIVNPDTQLQEAAPTGTAIEATRFESPWLRLIGDNDAAGNFQLSIDGNAQFTDRAPDTLDATLMIDVDVLYD